MSLVFKKVLFNGLTVLVRPTEFIPKVSVQLWYNVGSKHETTGQKGIAHLIEHMIFKGTEVLSESDINLITQKLSGYTNAFTSYDFTGYLFDFPAQNWEHSLPILADCMENCSFKADLLKSEMKAVVQELKMYKDNYSSSLVEAMVSRIFVDHPYHYPIIGFKQDLWNVQAETLKAFYKKYYRPNNAVLVVVGAVDPERVFELAEKHFGSIEPNPQLAKETFYHGTDIANSATTLYRDIKEPIAALAFTIPNQKNSLEYILDVLSFILGSGKASRLYHKIVDELELANDLETFSYLLFDYGVFFIVFQPRSVQDIPAIRRIIEQELIELAQNGPSKPEVQRAIAQAQAEFYRTLESTQRQAYMIGQTYLATEDENFIFKYANYPADALPNAIQEILNECARPSLLHEGSVLPLNQSDRDLWQQVQERSDREDARILSGIARETVVEPGKMVNSIAPAPIRPFAFPKPQKVVLDNGLTILYYHNPNVPKVHLALEFKARHTHDPADKLGLCSFLNRMLPEGTKNYDAKELAFKFETLGASVDLRPGYLHASTLSANLVPTLALLKEMLMRATFPADEVEKIRTQLIADINMFWDAPMQCISQLVKNAVYANHPYSKPVLGTIESVGTITQQDLIDSYKNYFTPHGTVLSIVGDFSACDIERDIIGLFKEWDGSQPFTIEYPAVSQVTNEVITYPMQRDQVALAFAGNSITRADSRYDALLLADQIITGGSGGSMASRLFELREQSGLFYSIGGSLLANSDEQAGMVLIKTMVSPDRVAEAEKAIKETLLNVAETLTEEEVIQAQNVLINGMVENFESNGQIATTFLFLQRFNLPIDYFDTRPATLKKIQVDDIKKALESIFSQTELLTVKVGRL